MHFITRLETKNVWTTDKVSEFIRKKVFLLYWPALHAVVMSPGVYWTGEKDLIHPLPN